MTDGTWRWLFLLTIIALTALVGVWRLDVRLDRVEDGRVRPPEVHVIVTYPPAPAVSPPAPRVSPSRASRTRRAAAAPQRPAGAAAWAATADAVRVANCESADLMHWPYSDGSRYLGGDKGVHLRDPNGHYGKWQFAPATWRSVGGTGNAADASEAEQDARAYLLWKRDGWWPWTCARKLGIE